MKKRVTYAMAFMFMLGIVSISADHVFALDGSMGQDKEKNIHIKILGDEDGSGTAVAGGDETAEWVEKGVKCAFIGINMEDLTKDIIDRLDYPKKTGVLVAGVVDDSAADKAGLMKGDIIYSFDGAKVSGSEQLAGMVREKKPGDRVELVYYRGGTKKEQEIELGERSYDTFSMDWSKYGDAAKLYAKAAARAGKNALLMGRDWHMTRGRLGLVLKDLNDDLAPYFDRKPGEGVLVVEVLKESPAEEAGVKAGDVVVMISGKDVSGVEGFLDEIYQCTGGENVEIELVRKGKREKITLDVGDEFRRFMFVPGERIKRIEISEEPELLIHRDEALEGLHEKKALEAEIEALRKEIERLEKRLDKIEQE